MRFPAMWAAIARAEAAAERATVAVLWARLEVEQVAARLARARAWKEGR